MIYKIPRVLSQVCHQDAGRAVGAHLQHNSSILERIGQWLGAVCLLVLMQGAALAAESFPARVLRVVDGDTLWVMPQHEVQVRRAGGALERSGRIKLRIEGIDAPEMRDPGGRGSQAGFAALISGQMLACDPIYSDRYGRSVARCCLQGGTDLGCALVAAGAAQDWPKYSGGAYAGCDEDTSR